MLHFVLVKAEVLEMLSCDLAILLHKCALVLRPHWDQKKGFTSHCTDCTRLLDFLLEHVEAAWGQFQAFT